MLQELQTKGYQIKKSTYTKTEIQKMLQILEQKKVAKKFGVRRFLVDNSELLPIILNDKMRELIQAFSDKALIIKSIYFDKPPNANWIVNWHQDITINVDGRVEADDFKNWRVLKERTVVQPSVEILENILTVRIHLDDCRLTNGALQVIPNSHLNGITKVENVELLNSKAVICEANQGDVLLMKPLILHASKRVQNNSNRRVIHIEFCDKELPKGLSWNEEIEINKKR